MARRQQGLRGSILITSISVEEISRRLTERCEEVCRFLLPGGKIVRGEWQAGDVTGSNGNSLHVQLEGAHAGHFKDFASEEDRGDLIDLWRLSRGLTPGSAIKEAKAWLGINEPTASQSERIYGKPAKDVTGLVGEGGTALRWFSEQRKISPGIVNRFRVEGSKQKKAIAFPCYSPSGHLVNRSYRTLGDKKEVWQEKGCAPSLFGWQALPDVAYKESTVILCEGQIDCMTWAQWGFPALSIPNGSGLTWIEYEWDNLQAFDRIYLSFDMDGAGAEIAEKVINRLGRHRCLLISLPKKDANDCLLAGYTADDATSWVTNAKAPGVKGLVVASDLEQRVIRYMEAKQKLPFTLPFFRGKDPAGRDGFYPRPGEVTIWSGMTHHGKSTVLNYFMLSLLETEHNIMVASMEMQIASLIVRMVSAGLKRDPRPDDIREFLKRRGPHLVFADKIGYIGQEELVEMMRYSYQRYGVTHVFVDSLMRVSKLEEDYVAQGDFLNILTEFAKTSNTHIHLVAHPKKRDEDGRFYNMDIKGSSMLPNNADNVVFVIRNVAKERLKLEGELTAQQAFSMHDTEISVEKQRETGWIGSFYLHFDPLHYAYSVLQKPS